MVENVNIEMATAPAPALLEVGSEAPPHAASEITREVQAYQEHISQLARAIFNQIHKDDTGELSVKLSELGERSAALEHAISTNDTGIIAQRASEVAAYITANYGHFREAIAESEQELKEREKKGRELAAIIADEHMEKVRAAEIERTRRYMNNNIEGFKDLNEPAQRYMSESIVDYTNSTPETRYGWQLVQAVDNDPEMKQKIEERRTQAKDAWTQMYEQAQSEEMKKRLEELKALMGERRIPPELIEIHRKLAAGEIDHQTAEAEVTKLAEKTKHTVEAMHERAMHFSSMSDTLRNALKDHFRERFGTETPSGAQIQQFIEQMKKEGKLAPENINRIAEELHKNGGDFSKLSKEDQLSFAAGQLNFNVEASKTIHNLAEHIVHLPEKDKQKFIEKLGTLYDARDIEGLTKLLEENGITQSQSSREVRATVAFHLANIDKNQMTQVIKLKAEEIKTGVSRGKEIGAIYRQEYQEGMAAALKEAQIDVTGLSKERLEEITAKLGLKYNAELLEHVYGECEVVVPTHGLCPLPDEHGNIPDKTSYYSIANLFGGAKSWLFDTSDAIAALDDQPIGLPAATPQNEATHALRAASQNAINS